MKKIAILMGLVLLCPSIFSYAAERKVTLTTYYPAPYGEYQEVKSDKVAVGSSIQPVNVGNVVLKAQTGDPVTKTGNFASGVDGELAYSATNDQLYAYNGSAWNPAGGGGTCFQKIVTGNTCNCDAGWTKEKDIGFWGRCETINTYFPPGDYFPSVAFIPSVTSAPAGPQPCQASSGGYYDRYNQGRACLCCES